jgi:hypothetical protein
VEEMGDHEKIQRRENTMEQQYDTVVLGFDEESQATVQSLRDQGKRVLYIPVDPRTWVTIMTQTQVNAPETSDIISHLQVQQQHMCTSMHDTTTYMLQPFVQQAPDIEQQEDITINGEKTDTIVEDLNEDVIFSDSTIAFDQANLEEKEQEIEEEEAAPVTNSMEEQQTEVPEEQEEQEENINEEEHTTTEEESSDHQEQKEEEQTEEPIEEPVKRLFYGPTVTPLTKESSLIDDRLFGIRGTRSNLFSHHLFNPIRIENEDEPNTKQTSEETQNTLPNSQQEKETANEQSPSPITNSEEEENQTSSPKFIFHGPPVVEEQQEEPTAEIKTEPEEPIEEKAPEELIDSTKEKTQSEQTIEKTHEEQETSEEDTTPFRRRKKFSFQSLQPETKQEEELERFSPRRRNKKNRLFSSLDITSSVTTKPTSTSKPEKTFSSLIQDSIIPQETEESTIENKENDIAKQTEETTVENNELSADNLKIDNIEFEEPYGYNSFEDFFPSFSSSNDRKRQELDKIEKRKIALRGLHNLINNLG